MLTEYLSKQGSSWSQQAKEGFENNKERDLTETAFIKAEINRMRERMGWMEHDHNPPMESLRREVAGLRQGMLKTSSIEKWSEDMDSAITPVLLLL